MVTKMVKAELMEDKVIVEEQKDASRIYNKGFFGIYDGKLELNLVEACYLLDKGKFEVEKNGKKLDLKKFMEHSLSYIPDFEIKYFVYRDLRERGYVIKEGNDFVLYERGKKPPAKPSFTVKAISERAKFKIKEMAEFIEKAKNKLIVGVADEEGDLTYYIAKFFKLKGGLKERKYEGKIILLNDRCIVWDENLMEKLKEDFIGRDFGKYIQISLTETCYLAEKGAKIIKNGRKIGMKRFIQHAKKIQPDIENRFKVYSELRKLKLLPKTGFKFGSHFRVYSSEPEKSHAPYLIHVVGSDYEATWAEISRAVRLAHSVKKEMIFCMVDDEIKYIRLKRITP
ncbi:MAG TPA: tRNA-intron lyase [Thermoplasmatales archaeon]|nr:tRNA-intron lyase [Thermoplasmatales archaeon]